MTRNSKKIKLPAILRERWAKADALCLKADALCLKADDETFAPHLDVYFMEPRTRWIVGHLKPDSKTLMT